MAALINPLPHVVNDDGIIINPFVQLTPKQMKALEKFERSKQKRTDRGKKATEADILATFQEALF
jgi:hypothetical protein